MRVHIFQGSQQTYGVGMPIILAFSGPVTRKAVVSGRLPRVRAQAGPAIEGLLALPMSGSCVAR